MLTNVFRFALLANAHPVSRLPGWGQGASGTSNSTEVVSGSYVIHQSMNLGVRVSDPTGSAAMYDTRVNIHSGPRVLDQMLSMRSENHQGVLFDNFLVHRVGWGGYPDNVLRLKRNALELQYDFSRKLSGRFGYRYDRRRITHNVNDLQNQAFYPSLPNRGACAGQPLVNGV